MRLKYCSSVLGAREVFRGVCNYHMPCWQMVSEESLELFINMAGRNKMSSISNLTPLIIFILYYFSCIASVSFIALKRWWFEIINVMKMNQRWWWAQIFFFYSLNLLLFTVLPKVIIQNCIKTDGMKVKKNDNPFIIMTNYDLFEFFNLWIWSSTV